ncbi:BPM6 [Symbiodinium necroappetens]|uniref:BPM6 protein n=1 Tax=Symbiodinium necroappetens TaxID=1628268 RepID=A0A812X9G4_9DINO|nr:BPM6 [Symbiodinium necroappetens]|mmetsp:Transcript_68318/g.162895  ORF Transcript_68318/g.162895 Transcript_68318/m.162895 type:complete len:495 (+) Transcript_68318:43-1527(+)
MAKTSEELRAEIESTNAQLQAAHAARTQLQAEIAQAVERQRLRQELEEQQLELSVARSTNRQMRGERDDIDADRRDCNDLSTCPAAAACSGKTGINRARCTGVGPRIAKGEYVWELQQMSWLDVTLQFRPEALRRISSHSFEVGGCSFDFLYRPDRGGLLLTTNKNGSLAIRVDSEQDIAFRYSIYIKRRGGDFVQWGETTDARHHGSDDPSFTVHGPDVHLRDSPNAAVGIFGLTHSQLLRSEWVEDDTLTVKFVLEVRPDVSYRMQQSVTQMPAVEIPEATMIRDTQALFEEGTCSDVQFRVQGETIQAHSQVLSARSEVFRKQLSAGMQESVTRVINIEDCEVSTFKAFLRFLYTDLLPSTEPVEPGAKTEDDTGAQMLALLAVSHKYQATRLQLWCEAQLCNQLCTSEVCDILCQAHVFEAKQLEKACYTYIKDHMVEVLKLPAYAELVTKRPDIGMKVSLFMGDVPETDAEEILQASKVRRLQAGKQRM